MLLLYTICRSINNYFHLFNQLGRVIAYKGHFTIDNGVIKTIDSSNFIIGQYVRIYDSILNDGIYKIENIGEGYIDVSIHNEDYPTWIKPTGLVDSYNIGDRVTHDNIRYVSLINANVFVPGTDVRWWEPVSEIEHSVQNEIFDGAICPLKIPKDFIQLSKNIEKYADLTEKDPKQALLMAESFAGYSYTKATNPEGIPPRWQNVFSQSLRPHRTRMFTLRI